MRVLSLDLGRFSMTETLRFNETWYRACARCRHATDTHCKAPEVVGTRRTLVPFAEARAATGPCGPKARYLDFPGLHP